MVDVKRNDFKNMTTKALQNLYDIHNTGIFHGNIHLQNVVYKYKTHDFFFIDFGSSTVKNMKSESKDLNQGEHKNNDDFQKDLWKDYMNLYQAIFFQTNYRNICDEFLNG
ncbi:uncharacterized protein ASCRUDRAFT_81235 [Ascoidea rubescens DSM 1968]|uniref:Protein kinase domain-containing protein n=1 Tax=Ascoidea rubescens DSM 1968 TaxID=1344418 RepID=A0A1D2VGY4_9ASCO|nr:hypothetical protein ASCRUDRAFT_81235 [Ascoidea rubescens DSM 1968]ODV60896.1 hypothetical protein ASCRUDRAFT_81235 [Ascoidea rubescens DSM 1968]